MTISFVMVQPAGRIPHVLPAGLSRGPPCDTTETTQPRMMSPGLFVWASAATEE